MDLELDDLDLDIDDAEDLDALYALAADKKPSKRRGRGGTRSFRLFNVIGKTQFDYTFLDVSTSQTVVLAKALPLSPFYHYWFGVRIHRKDMLVGSFQFNFYNTLPSAEDPREFSLATAYQNLQVLIGDAAPSLKMATELEEGPFTKVTLVATQGTGVPPLRLYAELSLVVLARQS